MRYLNVEIAGALAAALPMVFAQTFTPCNPTSQTCPKDMGLKMTTYVTDFTQASANWNLSDGTTITYGEQGAEFTIVKNGQAPTMQTDFYIFFGKVEAVMQAAPGVGIVSSIVLESDDLDEIDWEFLGSDSTEVQTNFFGKGNTTLYNREASYNVATPQQTFHTYTVEWTSQKIEWSVDGTSVRTLLYADPLTIGGSNYPQTPMRVKLGNWPVGPDASAGTKQWAGGNADFSKSPFTMYVKSVAITNYNPADSYIYSDTSGSYESITFAKDGNLTSSSSSASVSSAMGATLSATSSSSAAWASGSMIPTLLSGAVTTDAVTTLVVSRKTTVCPYGTGTRPTAASSFASNAVGSGTARRSRTAPAMSASSMALAPSSGVRRPSQPKISSTAATSPMPARQTGSGATSVSAIGSLMSVAVALCLHFGMGT